MKGNRLRPANVAVGLLLVSLSVCAWAEALDQRIEQLKSEVAALSLDLLQLQEDSLLPPDSQVAFFLSVDSPEHLTPETVELWIDGIPATSHLYSDREQDALADGALQQLYVGNVSLGAHQLQVKLTAQAANDRYVRREAGFEFRKRAGEARIELELSARGPGYEPSVDLREWR